MIYPKSELSVKRIQLIKDATKRKLLEKATRNWSRPVTDFVLRETVQGDATVNNPSLYDIQPHATTPIVAGIPIWGFDVGPLVDNVMTRVTKSAATIDDNKWVGFYGFYDTTDQGGELTGAADRAVHRGRITAVEYKRGSSVLDLWHTEDLYAYEEVVGFTDTPVIYEENEAYEILVNTTEDDEDIFAGLRGYTCESIGQGHLNPSASMDVMARATRGVTGVNQLSVPEQIEAVMRAGMDPVQEMTPEMISRLYDRAKLGLYTLIVESGAAKTVAEAKKNYHIRPFCGGDVDAVDTYIDVDNLGTTEAGEENWIQEDGDITAGDLVATIASGETINDRDFVVLLGVADRSPNSSLLSIAPGDNAGNLDYCDVQHLYAYKDAIKGYTQRLTYYRQNSPFQYKMNFAMARDNYVMPIGLIAEPFGSVVSSM